MKLLFVTEFFPSDDNLKFTGGVEAFNFYLIEQLAKRHDVTVICSRFKNSKDRSGNQKLNIVRVGPQITRTDASIFTIPKRLIFGFYAINEALKEEFDIIQGNNFITYIPAFVAGYLKRKPTIAWYPDVFIGRWVKLTGFFSGIFGELVERISLKLPWTKFIALSESTKNKLLKNGIKQNNVEIIYAGVDLKFFNSIRIKKVKTFTICCISRLVNYKNLNVLIKAGKILKDNGKIFKIIIIGDGPEKNNLTDLIQESDLNSEVLIKSDLTRPQLGRILKSSKLFCLPSSEEGFGLVVLEAVASKVPYLISNIPVLKEITHGGQGGLLFKEKDPKDLAKMIALVMRDKKLADRLVKEGQKLLDFYSWKKIADQFEDQYLTLRKKTKILMLSDAWFPHIGGGQIHTWELTKRLSDLGCEITILTRNMGDWSGKYKGIKVKRVGFIKRFDNIFGRMEYLFRASFYSLFANYDIFHAHAFSPGLIAPIAILRNKPTIFTVHGAGWKIAGFGITGNFLQDLVFYKIPYNIEITVAKNTIKKKSSAKRVVLIPNGVNIEQFKLVQRERGRIKSLIYVGRLFKDKGVLLLIDAFKGLDRNIISLTIVGDGPEMNSLKKQAKGLGIRFKGQLVGQELREEMKKADLLIMPSLVEGMPIRLLEAWAGKLPVLATRVGDNEVYIKDGINGFLCEPSSESIKTTIKKILTFRGIDKIGEQGFKEVKEFSWDKIAGKTYKLYQEVLSEKS